jgi:hypothetical protein
VILLDEHRSAMLVLDASQATVLELALRLTLAARAKHVPTPAKLDQLAAFARSAATSGQERPTVAAGRVDSAAAAYGDGMPEFVSRRNASRAWQPSGPSCAASGTTCLRKSSRRRQRIALRSRRRSKTAGSRRSSTTRTNATPFRSATG